MILAERAAHRPEALAARAAAVSSGTEVMIARLKLEIEKLRRELYGSRSECGARLREQMELQLEDIEPDATEDETRCREGGDSIADGSLVRASAPVAKPFREHLPRERIVIAALESCPCCGSTRLSNLSDVTR